MPTTVNAASKAALVCNDVSVRAGQRGVVSRFSWQHRAGGIAWLFGSNGSGKSSLLRVLARFQRPASGYVDWGSARKVNFLTPAMSAPPELRVCDFVQLVEPMARGTDSEELRLLLPDLADNTNRFRILSTGEAKRLLLWSILRQRPPIGSHADRILILDEPYEHLSRDAKTALTVLLQQWAEQSVVVVATNQDVPLRKVDTVLTLDGSRLEVGRVS